VLQSAFADADEDDDEDDDDDPELPPELPPPPHAATANVIVANIPIAISTLIFTVPSERELDTNIQVENSGKINPFARTASIASI